jgi:23S rRNA-/tRNA-specific pseudouridylate synthase
MSADALIEGTDPIVASFPAGIFGDQSVRLSLLHNDDNFFALSKPAGISVRQHPWEPGANLDRALNDALQQKKQWLTQLNCKLIGSVFPMDQSISGPVLFAKNAPALSMARNAYGSYTFLFRFLLIVEESDKLSGENEVLCQIPLRANASQARLHPSRRRGKRSDTRFKRLHSVRNGWSLWQAETTYPRLHQIRAHAQALGMKIAGDAVYGTERVPVAKELLNSGSGPGLQKPLLSSPAIHLQTLTIPALAAEHSSLTIDCPAPVEFSNCLRKAGW